MTERRPDAPDAPDAPDRPDAPDLPGEVDLEAGAAATAASAGEDVRAAVDEAAAEPGAADYERLSDYLDAGRSPYDPALEEHPGNRAQLAALERLRALTAEVLAADVEAEPAPEPSWIAGIMDRVRLESRSGREIPLASPDPRSTLRITEGAVRALVRESGDRVPGAIVLSCTLHGDVTAQESPVTVEIAVSVRYGAAADDVAEGVRRAVHAALLAQTELLVAGVDVLVRDVHVGADDPADPAASADPVEPAEPVGPEDPVDPDDATGGTR